MVDIQALMSALPVSGLQPNWVASLGGLIEGPKRDRWREQIQLLEPPAGQHIIHVKGAI